MARQPVAPAGSGSLLAKTIGVLESCPRFWVKSVTAWMLSQSRRPTPTTSTDASCPAPAPLPHVGSTVDSSPVHEPSLLTRSTVVSEPVIGALPAFFTHI